ncbi:hypothetical protein M569_13936, partial [Genlisea aurea]
MKFPDHFRCPISLEVMEDPVTISTGVTYERSSIERWVHGYKKKTCPATMQPIETAEMTPNHTLKRLISAWRNENPSRDCEVDGKGKNRAEDMLLGVLREMDRSPFKVNWVRKIRAMVESGDDDLKMEFKKVGGIEALVEIMVQILDDGSGFGLFRAAEEAVGLIDRVPVFDFEEGIIEVLMGTECVNSLSILLRRGGGEARVSAISIFSKISRFDRCNWKLMVEKQGIDFFKSLFEIVSDEFSTTAGRRALDLLTEIFSVSKKSRVKAVESGGIFTLVEILPDSGGSRCEKILRLLKFLCECSDGRMALADHGMGIAAVAKTMRNVSPAATRAAVKILWL